MKPIYFEKFMKIKMLNIAIFFLLSLLITSCSSEDQKAKDRLAIARKYYQDKEYALAKQEIDSIKRLHPKALNELKSALALQDSVRRASDMQQIQFCDSIIALVQDSINDLKKTFIYEAEESDIDNGHFSPKETYNNSGVINKTTLRSGVKPDGELFLESVYIGGQKHNTITLSNKSGDSESSKVVEDDGFNYRFSNLNKQYEIIKFIPTTYNEIPQFVYKYREQPLIVTLKGKYSIAFPLSVQEKKGLLKSYQLSQLLIYSDSLKAEKGKAEYRLQYLDQKVNSSK